MRISISRHVAETTLAGLADGLVTDSQLTPGERRHLANCGRCQGLLEGHRRASRLLAADWQMVVAGEADAANQSARQVAPLVAVLAMVAVIGVTLWNRGSESGGPRAEPSPWPMPSPSGVVIDRCNPGAVSGPGWPGLATPAGAAADVRPGMIAGWAISPRNQLVKIADANRGTMTQLTQTPITYDNYEGGVVQWSPDGRALAVGWAQRDCQDLFVASGGAFTRASAAPVDAWRWSWSPDSSRLAATVGESNVVIVEQDGNTIDLGSPCDRCVVQGEYSPHGLSWSPDGSSVAAPYAIIDPEADVIVEAGVAFTDPDRPTWRMHSFDERWSVVAVVGWVDDDHLLVNRATGDDERGQLLKLSATTPDDAEALAIEVPSGSAPSLVQIAPDRASVMISTGWQARPQAVVVAELATGDQAVVYSGEASVVTSAWSPDSSAVAVVTGTGSAYGGGYERYEMAVLELATGAQQVVWTGLTDGGGLVWSPDSSQLAISGGPENGLWVVNRDGSRLRRVSDTPLWFMSWQPVWP